MNTHLKGEYAKLLVGNKARNRNMTDILKNFACGELKLKRSRKRFLRVLGFITIKKKKRD